MSYKTFVNNFQILENGVYREALIAELNRQGANIKDRYSSYEFEIKEIDPIIKIVDEYIKEEVNDVIRQWQNPYDLTFHWTMINKDRPLYDRVDNCIYTHYLFQSYRFMQYLYRHNLVKRNADGTHTILKKIVISGG